LPANTPNNFLPFSTPMSQPISPEEQKLRQRVSDLLASFSHVHLEAEVQKPDAVLHEVFKDLPVRRMLTDLQGELLKEFPSIATGNPAPYNIFIRWCEVKGSFS